MEQLFFELVQVALGRRDSLNRNPSEKEWYSLFAICKKQAVVGVAFSALDKLSKYEQKPPLPLLFQWIAMNEQINKQNRIVNRNAVDLCKTLEDDGFRCCILKGQGNNLLYPNPFLRQPGDIDVWTIPIADGKEIINKVIQYIKKRYPKAIAQYHHIEMGGYCGTDVEVHYRPTFMNSLMSNRRLQKWMDNHANEQFVNKRKLEEVEGTICIPTWRFNVIFQLSHIYRHIIHRGLGLRQIIDYYYLLLSDAGCKMVTPHSDFNLQKEDITKTLKYLGLDKIAGALMWVLHQKLGLEKEFLIAAPDKKRGRLLLDEMLTGGNFGQSENRSKWEMNWVGKNVLRLKRDFKLMRFFPSECLWEPIFRVYHFLWRVKHNQIL